MARLGRLAEQARQAAVPDLAGALLLDEEVGLGHDAEHRAVIVDDGHAAHAVVDQQARHILQRMSRARP